MKTQLSLIAALTLVHLASAATPPFYDGFDYTSGANLGGIGSWVAASGSGTIKVGAGNLSYASLTNGVGKDVTIVPGGSAARVDLGFTAQSSGTIYFSFLLKINSLPSSQSLIAYASGSSSSDTTPPLGFFIKTTGQLGVGINTSSPQFSSEALNNGLTHLVVVGYTFGASDSTDVWIDPASLGGSAPAATGSFSASHNSSLSHFLWNTASGVAGGCEVDELRIGSTYADVTPPGNVVIVPGTNSIPRFIEALVTGGSIVLRGTNGTPLSGYEILTATNPALPGPQWSVIASNTFSALGSFDTTNPLVAGAVTSFYRLRVRGATNSAPAVAPTINSQPQNQSAALGQGALFSVSASGTAPLSYQWFFNTNTPLTGETNASLLISEVSSNDVGVYSVTITNVAGFTNSLSAALTLTPPPTNGDYFVSTTGNDGNPGTPAEPFATVAKATSVAQPGDVIYIRGGTYFLAETIRLTNSGTAGNTIKLWAYPGEKPILDFTNQPYGASYRGILMTGNYWFIKGLEICHAGDNAIKIESSHNRVELCVFHHNGDTGLQIGFAHETVNDGSMGAYNEIVNCDSYMNFDFDNIGSDADGFACKLHPGFGNVFSGCRAWDNSDDAWDLFETDHDVVITNCWAWHSGDRTLYEAIYLAKMGKTMSSFQGNGNGFKLGGNGTGGSSAGTHSAIRCVAFNCAFQSKKGFDQNSHKGGVTVLNCTSFGNGYNFMFEDTPNSGKVNVFKNCVEFGHTGAEAYEFAAGSIEESNSWQLPVTASAADFDSIAEAMAAAPRNPDGSLPTGFARLVSGSDLIDKGVNVGIPFSGSAPDLGAFEYEP